ncbi:MAG: SDR family NAD(P)-dependent oxidoreductase [Terriglobales bacterium]
MGDMKGRVALVTAGSKGLGAEVVRQLARRGADVAFTYKQDAAAAKMVVAQVRKLGRRCLALRADAGDFEKAHLAVAQAVRRLGGLHILVCNAGIARSAALWKMKETDWDDVMAVTLKGAFNYLHAAAPIFMEQNYGKVVCVGSINGLRGRLGSLSYNVAKAGLTGLVKTAAAELGRYNVNVNLVAPGFIESPSQANTPELVRDLVLKECALKRLGTPKDIAAVVVFLCLEAARHVTGQTVKVDAGQYL